MGSGESFSIDLGELDDVIGDVERCEQTLETLTADLERRIAALHDQWEGLSATAQREAHQEWARGMSDMRAALGQMRRAARVAHANYTKAITTNVGMWEGLR